MSYVYDSFLSQDIWSSKPMCVVILYFFKLVLRLVKGGATYAMR